VLAALIGLLGVGGGRSGSDAYAAPDHPGFQGIVPAGSTLTDAQCRSCHQIDAVFSHPVGMSPGRPIPSVFPLDHGRMTCVTCHENDANAHARARGTGDPLLRVDAVGQNLCMQCHEGAPMSAASGHAAAVSRAHLAWPGERPTRGRGHAGLDAESASCLECHDGTIATGVGTKRLGPELFSFGPNQDHPVGVVMGAPQGRDRSKDMRTKSAHGLDPRIRLYDGAVGCGSCHSVYSPLKADLVMSNQRSALCMSCHEDR
jgi:predicted CXXCH cytochrome family protein